MSGDDIRISAADLTSLAVTVGRLALASNAIEKAGSDLGRVEGRINALRELYDSIQRAFGADVNRPEIQGTRQAMTAAQGAAGGLGIGVAAGVLTLNPLVGTVVGGAAMVGGALLGAGEADRLRVLERQLLEERNKRVAFEDRMERLQAASRPWAEHRAALRRARAQ